MSARNKKGLSEVIGYVLLILIALSLSVAVYAWVNYVLIKPVTVCHDDVSLTIEDYVCGNGNLQLTLRNRGLHDTGGFAVKVRETGKTGPPIMKVKSGGEETNDVLINFDAGTENIVSLGYPNAVEVGELVTSIDMIQIEPIELIDGNLVYCKDDVIKQELIDC